MRVRARSKTKSQELEEVKHLRKEVRELRMEREILKKATAFFVRESNDLP